MFITLRNATKIYGEGETLVYALDHVNLGIEKGEICVILGPSGSGKSTLLNMLGGLDHLDEGEMIVGERVLSDYKTRRLTEYRKEDVGFVFQFYNLIPDLTVAENIEVVSDISAQPLEIDEVLEAMGIEKYRYRFPRELSGGQQQRVAITNHQKNGHRGAVSEYVKPDEFDGILSDWHRGSYFGSLFLLRHKVAKVDMVESLKGNRE